LCYIEVMFKEHHRRYVQAILLVLPMTGIVTAINTMVAKGIGAVFTLPTLHRWGISFVVAYPCVLFMMPLATKLTNRLIKS
jgi:hypothetical protein